MLVFQSTPPVKAATQLSEIEQREREISIHAAREGGDALARTTHPLVCIFQSTPPVKAATWLCVHMQNVFRFQSTPPVKAATVHSADKAMYVKISIHAAREGGDY